MDGVLPTGITRLPGSQLHIPEGGGRREPRRKFLLVLLSSLSYSEHGTSFVRYAYRIQTDTRPGMCGERKR